MPRKKKSEKGNLCHDCGAECCKYFAIYISEPADIEEYDAIKWYLHHKKVCVYVDKHSEWYVHVEVSCKHLSRNAKCRIYEKRPIVCRNYQTDACERAELDVGNIVEFYSVEELEEFFNLNFKTVGDKVRRRFRSYRAP